MEKGRGEEEKRKWGKRGGESGREGIEEEEVSKGMEERKRRRRKRGRVDEEGTEAESTKKEERE